MIYKTHVFICTNKPENPAKCGSKGAIDLHGRIKAACAEKFGKSDVRINVSGCLGQCEQGIAVAIYPHNQWLLEVKADEDQKIINAIEGSLAK